MTKKYFFYFVALLSLQLGYAQTSDLSVEKIMQDPAWMGTFPSGISWGAHSENIYFRYNPDGHPSDSLYRINIKNPKQIHKVTWQDEEKLLPAQGDFNKAQNKKVFIKDGALYLYDFRRKEEQKLLELGGGIANPQ